MLYQQLDQHLALCYRPTFPPEQCARLARGVYEGRSRWNRDFDGEQYSLGRAWYTHLEQGRSQEYFAHARASDRDVERFLPGMQEATRACLRRLLRAEVTTRPGWCGPGVHIFPPEEWVAKRGGVIHSDLEGLSEAHVMARERALSCVWMLQTPPTGGGLRLWDALHFEDDAVDPEALDSVAHATFRYEDGDLLVFDSYRLHQIQPFGGERERLSVTAHAARCGPGRWEVWF